MSAISLGNKLVSCSETLHACMALCLQLCHRPAARWSAGEFVLPRRQASHVGRIRADMYAEVVCDGTLLMLTSEQRQINTRRETGRIVLAEAIMRVDHPACLGLAARSNGGIITRCSLRNVYRILCNCVGQLARQRLSRACARPAEVAGLLVRENTHVQLF